MDDDRKMSVLFTFSNERDSSQREEQLDFSASKNDFQRLLEWGDAGATDGINITPMFCENESVTPIDWLSGLVFNETCVNELNYLAAKLSELDNDALAKFEAVAESGRHCGFNGVGIGELADYINIAANIGNFKFFPNYDEQQYGEHLLHGENNLADRIIYLLHNHNSRNSDEFAQYVECLRDCTDAEQFGQSMASINDGEFLDSGYLIEDGLFDGVYQDTNDIPGEYRIWEPLAASIKVEDINLSALLIEMHALGGNYTQDAASNLQTLLGGDCFIMVNAEKLTVLPVEEVFHSDTPQNKEFENAYNSDVRVFFAHVEGEDDYLVGSIHEIAADTVKNGVAHLKYAAVNIDAEFKDGTNRLFTPVEWDELSSWERERVAGMVYRYNPADEQKVKEYLSDLWENGEKTGRAILPEDFLAGLNAPFMAKAQNAKPNMLRVARETARDMLARSDASEFLPAKNAGKNGAGMCGRSVRTFLNAPPLFARFFKVYRLIPEGPLKLSPLDAVKSGGLWFKEHREFAIKPSGMAGLEKWAGRTVDEIARQAMRGEIKKSRGEEL